MIMVFSSFVDKLIVSLIVEMICMGNFSSSDEMLGCFGINVYSGGFDTAHAAAR
jgi:hypothetical protein